MIKGQKEETHDDQKGIIYNYPMIVLEGAVIGTITGLVGAGGGFLIIPALVLLAGLPMKMAIGTSLLIIAVKSLAGFMGDLSNQNIDWVFLLSFTGIAIIGIFIGTYTSKYIQSSRLKKTFGWFIMIMAVYIVLKELFI
jgi:uncharacterized membrane protein YfcA